MVSTQDQVIDKNGINISEINLCIYGNLIYYKKLPQINEERMDCSVDHVGKINLLDGKT